MKWLLVFSLLFFAGCTTQTTAELSKNSSNQNLNGDVSNLTVTVTATPQEIKNPSVQNEESDLCEDSEPVEIPKTDSPIGKIDFNNFSYPKIWEKGSVKVKNGCFGQEITQPGLSIERYSLESVEFVDFNADGVDEALIEVIFFSGGVSTGSSENFYIYQLRGQKPNLIWRIATGSRAYCGTKDHELKDRQIILELFGKCTVKSDGNFKDEGKHSYDFAAEDYTKFVFGWSGGKFIEKSREVFPFPERDIKEYWNKKALKK
jgi:hypothetical protein